MIQRRELQHLNSWIMPSYSVQLILHHLRIWWKAFDTVFVSHGTADIGSNEQYKHWKHTWMYIEALGLLLELVSQVSLQIQWTNKIAQRRAMPWRWNNGRGLLGFHTCSHGSFVQAFYQEATSWQLVMFLCSSNGFEIILKHETSLLFNFNELFNRTGNSNNEKCKYQCVVLWTMLGLGNNM